MKVLPSIQSNKRGLRQRLAFIICMLVMAGLVPVWSQAQQNQRTGGISVTPVVIEEQSSAGETISTSLRVANDSDFERAVYTAVYSFTADPNEGGEPLVVQEGEEAGSYSLASWVTIAPGPHSIPSGGEPVSIPVTLTVPDNAEPGTHWGMIVVSEQQLATDTNLAVAIQQEIGTLLFVQVAGAVNDDRALAEFSSGRLLYWTTPVTFITRVANHGNVSFKPFGTITINNTFTGSEAAVLQVNDAFGNVLPESVRKFENVWEAERRFIPYVGRYSAELTISLGSTDRTEVVTRTFWLLPIGFLSKVAVVIVGLLLVLWLYAKYMVWRDRSRRK